MRAGRLDHLGEILSLDPALQPLTHGQAWLAINAKESTDPAMAQGLRTGARIEVRAWFNPALQVGRYLRANERLFEITSVRDVTGKRAELILTCNEFIGQSAVAHIGQLDKPCRVHLVHKAPVRDEFGTVTDYRTCAELLLLETGRIEANDKLSVAWRLYQVTGYNKDSDDYVVRGVWLRVL